MKLTTGTKVWGLSLNVYVITLLYHFELILHVNKINIQNQDNSLAIYTFLIEPIVYLDLSPQ
jgi:hypothetical protein